MDDAKSECGVEDPEGVGRVTWKSCCLTSDSEAVKYILTFAMSSSVLAFAFYRLTVVDDELALWVSVISGIMGTYLPSPLNFRGAKSQNP